MSAPKALNIIRLDQHEKSLLSKRSSKIINYHLHDPDQQKPQPLKKPVIKFYRPGNYNPTKQLINLHLSREKQVIHTTSNIPKQQQQQQYSIIQDNQVPRLVNGSDQDDDILPEARINRKIADLEISNKSLLKINEILESTVRHQAKQVASFKKLAMTVPNQDLEITQRAEHEEEEEEDWQNDEQFNRLLRMTEHLIEQAQRALTHQVETGGRVISNHQRSSTRIYYNNSQEQ